MTMTETHTRRTITYRSRDIGYGVEEEGEFVVAEEGERDWTGKTAFTSTDGTTLYLFDDEIVCDDEEEIEGEKPDVWELLETPPGGCADVADLYSWSLNYDSGTGPMALFLDLIGWSEDGWSEDELGAGVYDYEHRNLGYVELSKLADALKEYADRPHDVREYVDALMEAEARS